MRGRLWSVAVVLVCAFAAPRTAPADRIADWTVMLYFGGDAPADRSSLDWFVMDRVASLLGVPPAANVQVVALVDCRSREGGSAIRLVVDGGPPTPTTWAGAKLLHLKEGHAVQLENVGAVNLGDPGSLQRLLTVGLQRFPARRYALALKGHAWSDAHIGVDAVLGGGGSGGAPPAGSPDPLTISELHGVLATFADERCAPLDLLVLDGCATATVDTLGALSRHSRTIVASPDLLFARSVPYRALVEALATGAGQSSSLAGVACVDAYPEGSALRANLPLACPPSPEYGALVAVDSCAARRLASAFNALGRRALGLLTGATSAVARERAANLLGVARLRAFRFPNSTRVHFDAASVADEIAAISPDEELRSLAVVAAARARAARSALAAGPDLAGVCGISVCWPATEGSGGYPTNVLWSDQGWASFVREFESAIAPATSSASSGLDLETTADPSTGSVVVKTRHADGVPDYSPRCLATRSFTVEGLESRADARFLLPFARPPLVDGQLEATADFENRWAYGRIVFTGDAKVPGGPDYIECPIESIQRLPSWDGRGPVTCGALSSPLEVTLPGVPTSWRGVVQMRITLTQGLPRRIVHPGREFIPGTSFPWPDRFDPRFDVSHVLSQWVPSAVCAFARVQAPDPEPRPVPARVPMGAGVGAGGGDGAPEPPGIGVMHPEDTPRMIVFPDGTEVRTVRKVVEGDKVRYEFGPSIRLRTGRGCLVWRRFEGKDEVRVAHAEWLSDGSSRDSSTQITIPP